jgi:hypothetical protein
MRVLGEFLGRLGLPTAAELSRPSWNGRTLEQVYPWGTIRTPTSEANRATAEELSGQEKDEIGLRTEPFLRLFGYDAFLSSGRRAA